MTTPLLPLIEAYLTINKMSARTFGLASVGDPTFVYDLRSGRRVWPETANRVLAFMTAAKKEGGQQ